MASLAQTPLNQAPVNQMPMMQSPLAQLADIKTPEPISLFPMAIGWWILLLLMISLLVVAGIKLYRLHKQKQIQKQALKQFKKQPLSVKEALTITKWAAIQYFSRQRVANLANTQLANFLIQQLPEKKQAKFIKLSGDVWQQQYQKHFDNQHINNEFNQACIHWLTHALPPKNLTKANHKEQMK